MTQVDFYRTAEGCEWQGFRAHGHTGFAGHGEDIVCAAVSVLTQTAVLGLREVLAIDCLVQTDEREGSLLCLLPDELSENDWNQAQLILNVLYVGLLATEKEYGDHVSVKEVPHRENESAIIRLKKRRRKYEER
ncbi:MAG TPA: ribosomal-processing cysteine protease Prp [Limnochordia bacterium]|nr:ribosomal-processing cysteine protease Prp [Limnochordia bacterium]